MNREADPPLADRHGQTFLVEFRDRQLERSYRESAVPRDRWVAVAGVSAGGAVTLLFATADFAHFGPSPEFWTLLTVRGIFALATLLVVLRIRQEISSRQYEFWLSAWLILMGTVLVGINAARPADDFGHVAFDIAALLAIYVVFVTRFSVQVLIGLGFSLAYVLALTVARMDSTLNVRELVVAVASTNVFGILLAWRIHHLGRLQYASLLREKELRYELELLAYRDSLTNIANRREFMRRSAEELERYRRHGEGFSLILLDLDHFKQLNDRHGHGVGDEFLAAFARTLRTHARTVDVPARLGGEEFAVLLPETALADAERIATRIQDATAGLTVADGQPGCTVSAGVTAVDPADRNIEDALRRADRALYRAKAEGRNRVVSLAASRP